jgi:hypothetical protein
MTTTLKNTNNATILIDVHPGDEVFMPRYIFVTSENPLVLRDEKLF